jgi:hypothetical protein
MTRTSIAKLNAKLRTIGFQLAQAEMRGMKGGSYFARKLAHGILLNQLYDLEKRA